MKLYGIAVGNCEDNLKQMENILFVTYFEANAWAKEHSKEEFVVVELYLGNYSKVSFEKASNPLSIIDRQALRGTLAAVVREITRLEEFLDYENPRDSIFEASIIIKKNLKTLKSFLKSDICKEQENK